MWQITEYQLDLEPFLTAGPPAARLGGGRAQRTSVWAWLLVAPPRWDPRRMLAVGTPQQLSPRDTRGGRTICSHAMAATTPTAQQPDTEPWERAPRWRCRERVSAGTGVGGGI